MLKKIGPGLLYAGAAVGVSHLVQSTRAGADYGFSLLWVVIIANVIKYPFFEFAVIYSSSQGKNLIEGYKQIGNWAYSLFIMSTILTSFIILSAVSIVTAGIFMEVFSIHIDIRMMSGIILFICMVVLIFGKYNLLDNSMKAVILILTVTTIIALLLSFRNASIFDVKSSFDIFNNNHFVFLIALIGWMPAPFDISVWQSLWNVEKNKQMKLSRKDSLLDFKVGYWTTTFLAVCFLLLGAMVLNTSEQKLSNNGIEFSNQIITVFTSQIGNWAYPIISIAALITMFSTTITCLDGFNRVYKEILPVNALKNNFWIISLVLGTIIVLYTLAKNMQSMVSFATIVSFISAPILGYLNYKLVFGRDFPDKDRPSNFSKYISWFGFSFLVVFSLIYIYIII